MHSGTGSVHVFDGRTSQLMMHHLIQRESGAKPFLKDHANQLLIKLRGLKSHLFQVLSGLLPKQQRKALGSTKQHQSTTFYLERLRTEGGCNYQV